MRIMVERAEVDRLGNGTVVLRGFDKGGHPVELAMRRHRMVRDVAALLVWSIDETEPGTSRTLKGR